MNKKAIVYSTADGSEVVTFALGAAPNAVVFLNKGEHTKIGVGTFASELHFFSIAQQKELHSIKCSDVGSVNCMSTCIRKCASGTSLDREVVRLCAGCQSGAIFIWRLTDHVTEGIEVVELARLRALGPVLCLGIAIDGRLLAAAGESKVCEVWALTEQRPTRAGDLTVTVRRVVGLLASDISSEGICSSDPYMVLKLGNKKFRTTVKKRTLSPTYDESFKFTYSKDELPKQFETIDIVVYDEDYNSPMSFEKDDLLGTARIYVDQVRAPTSVSAADSTHQSALLLSRSARALVGSSGTRCAEERRSRLMSPSMTVRRCPLWRRFP